MSKPKKDNKLKPEDADRSDNNGLPVQEDIEKYDSGLLDPHEEIKPDMSKLNPIQQQVAGYSSTAKKEPPRIGSVKDLYTRIEMEVPKCVSRGPEYVYAWLAVADISSMNGTKWEIVTRSNHSHVEDRVFDMSGAILYKGQNYLAFCHREDQEAEQRAIEDNFNAKTERQIKTEEQAVEGDIHRIDPGSAGKVVNEVMADTSPMDDDF